MHKVLDSILSTIGGRELAAEPLIPEAVVNKSQVLVQPELKNELKANIDKYVKKKLTKPNTGLQGLGL